ncbi:uncharacterized protein LOC129965370 [Argiope bruennichi]|uniref:uncharacterized protein LOC129965370 n=1 Tax=Argiope bruennichi TaxID=94029 RepID=UPI002493F9F3|nr:uncharacterized protein LOC129965370 [Argiope bruennichi]
MQLHYVIRKQVSRVDLHKDGSTSLGIVLKDGVKTGSRPVIKAIKKGSVAYRSHCVSEKDAIVSVCGQDASGMSRRDFKQLLREAETKIELELEYQIREACLGKCGVYRMERIYLKLKKESESYGFVLRKYGFRHPASPGYPIISNIKEGGPADRDGRLKAGDRLLQIDEQDLGALSLSHVADILQAKSEATFTIEYKIALVENSQIRLGERTKLEIDCPDADLGLVLGSSGSRMVIEEIRKGGLADRCGAFCVGDDILAINDIDVSHLSTSKANSLLRNFKKEPGRLVLVANVERLARPKQNSFLSRRNIKPSFNAMPLELTPERDQQVPSSNHLLAPCNTPQSLFNGNFENNSYLSAEDDYDNFEIKAIVLLREIIKSIASIEKCISSLTSNNINDTMVNLKETEDNNNRNEIIQCESLSYLKVLSTRIKNLAHSMAMHFAKNDQIISNRFSKNDLRPTDNFKENDENLNQSNIIQELMENLVNIYTKKLISKQNFEKLQLKMNQINSDCKKCKQSRMVVVLKIQKILLIVSLNVNNEVNSFLIKKCIEDILRFEPCENCRTGSGSQTGSEISRTTHLFSSLDCLRTKPSSLVHSLNGETTCSLAAAESDTTYTTGENKLSQLHMQTSSSDSSFLFQAEFKSPLPSNVGSSANETISKSSSLEAISNLNCKTESSNVTVTETNNCEKCYQREPKTAVKDSLNFASLSHQPQYQSGVKTIHNSSLGFATPNLGSALYDRDGISGISTLRPSITRTPYNTKNNSPYENELLLCKENTDYEQKNIGKKYCSNIRKKIFSGKGMLKAQQRNCKSAEVIADFDSESLKHSKPTVQKRLSDPQYLFLGCQPPIAKPPLCDEKDSHSYAKTEIMDNKREIDEASAEANRYWSPFQRSDYNDHPNILDIPNWSAKSSRSLKQIDQVSNERTKQDTMDVTLKNEGKGYGLSVELLSLSSTTSTQVPRITAVSSQGAAHKIGILMKGDRVLAINGQNTNAMTVTEFENLKEEAFSAEEVSLTVEFDITVRDVQFGTFDVCVTKTSKTGLIYNDFKKGSPLVVKGIVKGSPAHRCGLLFPGDEVLSANNIRQEFYDVFKNTYERSEYVTIRVRRQIFEEKFGDDINLNQAGLSPFKSYDLSKTSIHSNHDSNKMFLEQELILYRDPVAKDFGFLIGQDQSSKTIYVTAIRPDGPADCSKVIRKNDIILQVNGVDLEANKDGPVASLFHPKGDRLELKTRRILNYE